MNKLIVRRSTGGWLVFAALGLCIMVIEYVDANYHFTGVAILGACIFTSSVVQLLFIRPQVVIDTEGISALVLGKRKFLWKEIRHAELKYMHRSGDKITLVLHDNTRHSFTLFGVDVSPDEVYDEIQEHIRKDGVNASEQEEAESQADKEWNEWLAANPDE